MLCNRKQQQRRHSGLTIWQCPAVDESADTILQRVLKTQALYMALESAAFQHARMAGMPSSSCPFTVLSFGCGRP